MAIFGKSFLHGHENLALNGNKPEREQHNSLVEALPPHPHEARAKKASDFFGKES